MFKISESKKKGSWKVFVHTFENVLNFINYFIEIINKKNNPKRKIWRMTDNIESLMVLNIAAKRMKAK